ncbi:MAG TPA: hypothetical protein VNJ52_13995 [Patescibacteria group bacterium]|nr:hypothetical protein [Patescibacteria group bacterium]
MSFELFIWNLPDEAWRNTGRRFKTRELAEAAGKALGAAGLIMVYSPDSEVRESSKEPNE